MKKNGKIYWRGKEKSSLDLFSLENISNTFRKNFSKKKTLTQNMFVKKIYSQIIRKYYWKNKNKQENTKIWKKEARCAYYLNCKKIWVTSPTFNFFPSWIKQSQTISTSSMEYDQNVANQYRANKLFKGEPFCELTATPCSYNTANCLANGTDWKVAEF